MLYLQAWRNPRLTPDDVIYAQPKVCRARKVVLGQEKEVEITCDKDDVPPIRKLRNELYPMRYASLTIIGRQNRIDETNEDEDEDEDVNEDESEENDEDEDDREDESVSKVTRF